MTRQQLAQQLRRLANDIESAVGEHVDKSLHEQADQGIAAQRFDREGGRSGDHSDPTFAQATRPQAVGAHRDHLQAWDRAIDAIGKNATILEKLIRENHPNSKQRPTAASGACAGGVMHTPNESVTRCEHKGCGKPWPCREGETTWFEACKGSINPATGKCGLCELSDQSMVCARCGTLGDRGDSRSGFCSDCRGDLADIEAERVRAQTRARVAAHRAKAKEDAA